MYKRKKAKDVIVELPPEPECPACGCRGAHFCVGTRDYQPIAYVAVRRPIHEEGRKKSP